MDPSLQGGTLLVLGASADQVRLITTAQRMGLRVLAVDIDEAAPGMLIADDRAVVSTRDILALEQLVDDRKASGTRFAGVTTMGSDIPQIVSAVAAHLGTPAVTPQSAKWTTDKYLMKARLRDQGIPVPRFMEVPTADDLRVAVDAIGLPVVIKPVDRSGARGVFLARDHSRLEEFYALALSESFSGRVMVEEYVPGPQISTETIMSAGRGVTPGFVDRNYDQLERFAPSVIENGGWAPSQLEGADRQTVEDLVVRASLALGIETGVTKGDVVIGPDGPMIIEMAARLSGGDFSESLVPLSTGVDYIAVAVDLATGIAPDLDCLVRTATQSVANRYFFPEPGVLMSIAGLDEARAQQWVRKLATWYEVGDVVPPVDSHAKRFGVFVVVGADRAEVDARVRWVYDTVKIETRPVAHE